MNRTLNIFIGLCTLLIVGCPVLFGAEVEFRASAPAQVVLGKPFQLTYSVNMRAKDFQAPDFEHFEHLAGPYTSQSSSTSFVNGKMTSSFQLTYTFTLMATEEGSFTIPPASIKADGDRVQSNGVRITVLPPDNNDAAQQNSTSATTTTAHANTAATGTDAVFIRTLVSKTKVHEQEALLLSYKLYFAGVDVAQFTNNTKLPDFTGFLKQEIEQGDVQTELEHYNGRNYQTATLYQTLLYPQHAGDIKIEPATFEAVLRVQTRSQVRSIFDDFFGSYTNVTKPLTAPGVTIHVQALPTPKPKNFSGAVGSFTLNEAISSENITANEALTLHIDISGTGNMKLLKTPAVDWPDGFEAYDPKVTNKLKTTTNGVSGTKSFEYLAIPRAAGDYTIPPVTFAYFDTATDSYKILSTPEYHLHITRPANSSESAAAQSGGTAATATQSPVRGYQRGDAVNNAIASDIRYIYTGPLTSAKDGLGANTGITPAVYWMAIAAVLMLGIILFIFFYRLIRENADITRVRYKRAGRVARKKLKTASTADEIEQIVLTYLSDRLAIPTADLSVDTIVSSLRAKEVPEALVTETRDFLTDLQFARYANNTATSADDKGSGLLNKTFTLIDHLESQRI